MIDLFNTSVQSPEGQRYIQARHERVTPELAKYPTLSARLFTESKLNGIRDNLLQRSGNLASLGYPCLYMAPDLIETGILPRDYLSRIDSALDFIIRKAPKQNRQDLIGRLERDNALTAIFELQLAWALCSHFGENQVEAYPKIAPDSKKNVEFAVVRDQKRILIEATTLGDTDAVMAERQFCLERGITSTFGFATDEKDMQRLFRACHEKIHQREMQDPLVLCVNQLASWPRPDNGAEVVGKLIAAEIWSRDSPLVGIAYFYSDCLVASAFAEARASALLADSSLLSETRTAFCRLLDPDRVATAAATDAPTEQADVSGDGA